MHLYFYSHTISQFSENNMKTFAGEIIVRMNIGFPLKFMETVKLDENINQNF